VVEAISEVPQLTASLIAGFPLYPMRGGHRNAGRRVGCTSAVHPTRGLTRKPGQTLIIVPSLTYMDVTPVLQF
jgi:hypothetical protein